MHAGYAYLPCASHTAPRDAEPARTLNASRTRARLLVDGVMGHISSPRMGSDSASSRCPGRTPSCAAARAPVRCGSRHCLFPMHHN